ncbi:semaphorin-5A-like [Hydra vulgaris]|uniref:Semaphorin-5A-like n=1 Tax=Hydra vulgaris TaxID=6087 RepID=A0ABM4BS44_HYDVU
MMKCIGFLILSNFFLVVVKSDKIIGCSNGSFLHDAIGEWMSCEKDCKCWDPSIYECKTCCCRAFWSPWSNWTSCNASYGFTNRTRVCNSSTIIDECEGNKFEVKECFAFWSQWSNWTSCNASHGFTSRTRECNSSTIIDECKGNKFEVKECFAFWSQWSNWTSCNVTHGFINRTRECNSSSFIYGCYGNSSEVKKCFDNGYGNVLWVIIGFRVADLFISIVVGVSYKVYTKWHDKQCIKGVKRKVPQDLNGPENIPLAFPKTI